MIEKSRLEELIKEGATIWSDAYDEEVYLNNKCYIEPYHNNSIPTEPVNDYVLWVYEDNEHINKYFISDLKEDVKSAKWASKYQRIPRTEYLDLPMWEEIENIYALEFGISCLEVYKPANKIFVMTNKNYLSLYDYIFSEPATEENYIKACDLCVKLFKGESDDDRN